jgi:competence protein ComEA
MAVLGRVLAAPGGEDEGVSDRTLAAALVALVVLAVTLAAGVAVAASRPVAPTPTHTPVTWQVHVSGAVVSPGTYAARPGDRVADALDAAGGTTPDADPDGVNPAMLLRDGQRVRVPRRGAAGD